MSVFGGTTDVTTDAWTYVALTGSDTAGCSHSDHVPLTVSRRYTSTFTAAVVDLYQNPNVYRLPGVTAGAQSALCAIRTPRLPDEYAVMSIVKALLPLRPGFATA